MKKILLTLLLAIFCLFSLAGCVDGDNPAPPAENLSGHTHTFDTSYWEYDENTHWRAATCDHLTERGSEPSHTIKDGK